MTTMDLTAFEETLPDLPAALANYVPWVKVGHLIYTSGMLPMRHGDLLYHGKLVDTFSIDEGKEAAELACLNALAVIKSAVGSLNKIKQIVNVTGYVASDPAFVAQPLVLNGASDLLVRVFGEAGKHTRAAVGVACLPKNAMVELSMIVEVKGK
jgi:enamine deaminase RidA (YjgF/YER057c/UK114 family)